MSNNLYYTTVTPLLRTVLEVLMREKMFAPFRLVGGTSLSLQLGHRMSDDIELFTDQFYGSIDFEPIDKYFSDNFEYVECSDISPIAFGKMYRIGKNKTNSVKIDLMYSDPFIRPFVQIDSIRLATLEEITAMKLEILPRGGRKKDFWDLHVLSDTFGLSEMLALHAERYPHSHDPTEIRKGLCNFSKADREFDPQCLQGKYWDLIKMDLIDFASTGK